MKIAIVGAGITGLATGQAILARDPKAEVVIFESGPRTGGKVLTEITDEGYLCDMYSSGVELNIELIRPLLKMYDLATYFPSKPSSEETGAKRGCIVLSRQGELADKLDTLSSLRKYCVL